MVSIFDLTKYNTACLAIAPLSEYAPQCLSRCLKSHTALDLDKRHIDETRITHKVANSLVELLSPKTWNPQELTGMSESKLDALSPLLLTY